PHSSLHPSPTRRSSDLAASARDEFVGRDRRSYTPSWTVTQRGTERSRNTERRVAPALTSRNKSSSRDDCLICQLHQNLFATALRSEEHTSELQSRENLV